MTRNVLSLVCILIAACITLNVYAEPNILAVELSECESCANSSVSGQEKRPLLDSSHQYITHRFDSVARWLDGFFGEARIDQESAHSFVRIRHDNIWQDNSDYHNKIRIRGKLRLPQAKHRLKLVFSGEDDDSDLSRSQTLDSRVTDDNAQQEIALEYTAKNKKRFKLDYRVGFHSGSELRAGVRVRDEWLLHENILSRLSNEIFWQDTRGFGNRTIVDLDYTPSNHQLIRWSSRVDYTEDTLGVPWQSTLSFSHIINKKRALLYYFQSEGETRPNYLTQSYGPGVLYRVNLFKRWFFLEFEPSYFWLRTEVSDRRKGNAAFTFRIEVVFSEKHAEK